MMEITSKFFRFNFKKKKLTDSEVEYTAEIGEFWFIILILIIIF